MEQGFSTRDEGMILEKKTYIPTDNTHTTGWKQSPKILVSINPPTCVLLMAVKFIPNNTAAIF